MIFQHKYPSRIKQNLHAFDQDCDDQFEFWSRGQEWTASFFTPGVAAGKAL